jgi:hypothetical protein
MTVVTFWLVPVFLTVRGLYLGSRDGFLVHAPLKIWAVWWTVWLARWFITYSQTHVAAGNICGRETAFTALWLTGFAVIHGAAVYVVRRSELTEKVYAGLNRWPWYLRWRRVDLIAGGVVQMAAALGVAYYMAAPLYDPPAGTPLSLVGPVVKTVGSKVASFLGLQGPDYFAIGGYQENFLHHSALSVNTCMQQTSHEPYGWLLFVWAFAIGPLFAIVCLQPVLYLSIWIKRLGRDPFYGHNQLACRSCSGRGIHVRNPLLFGTVCLTCRGSGQRKPTKSPAIAESEENHKENSGETKVTLGLVLKSYLWFWILVLFILPALIVPIALILKVGLWLF